MSKLRELAWALLDELWHLDNLPESVHAVCDRLSKELDGEAAASADTIPVRIAVAVSRGGECEAAVEDLDEDSSPADLCAETRLGECFGVEAARIHWVTASIPRPEPRVAEGEIEGEVEQ